MDLTRLFIGLLMLATLPIGVAVLWATEGWRASVAALHLRWEREQRQSGTGGVSLPQRQSIQARFEELVAQRPTIPYFMAAIGFVVLMVIAFLLTWHFDDVEWNLRWLMIPFAVINVILLLLTWWRMQNGATRLSAISSSLYGPAPPRVKVRNIRADDSAES